VAEPGQLDGLVGVAADVMESLGEVGVGLLVAAENLFPPIPSELVLPLAGFLAAQDRLSLALTILAATVGSLVGALVLYEIGHRLGPRRMRALVDRMPLMQAEDLDRSELWFRRYGEAAVLFGRCLPVVRSLISVPAGLHAMPRWRFAVLTTLGSLAWNATFVLGGFALGEQFADVERYSSYLNLAVYLAIGVLIALGVRRWLRERRAA
jgi:membrane protein DedA with SNARE-associated domain